MYIDMKNCMHYALMAAIALIATLSSSHAASAQMSKDQLSYGGKLGYVSENTSASIAAFCQYSFSEHLRIAPEIGYVFRHNDKEALTVDINAHMPLTFSDDAFSLYPLAGLNFSSWRCHYLGEDLAKHGHSYNRLGLNLGAGFDLRLNDRLKLVVEAKYTFTKRFSTAAISAGVSYTL